MRKYLPWLALRSGAVREARPERSALAQFVVALLATITSACTQEVDPCRDAVRIEGTEESDQLVGESANGSAARYDDGTDAVDTDL